jgi:hypothetical protein
MKMHLRLAGIALALMALWSCGDSGGGGAITDSYVFPAGKATIAFTAMSTAHLPASISGIDFAVTLPSGMSVATASGSSGQIATASIAPGSSLSGTNLAFGSYSASSGKTHLSMVTTSDTFRGGEFLRLTCTVAANTNITLGGLKALNTPVTLLEAVGYDPVAKSTVTLTNNVKVTIGVVN